MAEEINNLLSVLLLEELGFKTIERSNILSLLKQTQCTGRTALRDAVLTGVQMMLRLGETLRTMGCFENYNFVHVVLTDGADNESQANKQDLQKLFLLIGMTISVKSLTTHFIGVDMDYDDANELKDIATLGLENAYFHLADSNGTYHIKYKMLGIEKIFTKIIASIKQEKQIKVEAISMGELQAIRIQEKVNPYLQLTVKRYVVLFTLDRSGSMEGKRWTKVCQCVENFMKILGDNDLVAAIAFNNEVKVITITKKENQPKAIENESKKIENESKYIENYSNENENEKKQNAKCCKIF